MGFTFKRISFYYLYLIFTLFIIFFLSSIDIIAQEDDSIYIETITITVDSQELLNLEQNIEEIPIDYDLISLTESFILSYEQLSLNVAQFRYKLNYYFFNISYLTLTGYNSLFYYSSSYGSTFFQGFNYIEVFSYLPFYAFHFLKNQFEMYKKFINWNVNYFLSFQTFNLPEITSFSNFSNLYVQQEIKGENNNLDFNVNSIIISYQPIFETFIYEELSLSYKIYFNNNIYSKFGLIQIFQTDFYLRPEISLTYDFSEIDFSLMLSYDIILNSFFGSLRFSYLSKNFKLILLIKRDAIFEILNDPYSLIIPSQWSFFKDFFESRIQIEYKNDKNLSIFIEAYYQWLWKKSVKIYNDQYSLFEYKDENNIFCIYTDFELNWLINEYFSTVIDLKVNLPSYFLQNSLLLNNIFETFLFLSIATEFNVSDVSKLKFIFESHLIRFISGNNNPINRLNIEYKISNNNFDILLSLAINFNYYLILPSIESSILDLKIISQIYF